MMERARRIYNRHYVFAQALIVALLAAVATPQLIGQDRAHAAIFVPMASLAVAGNYYLWFVQSRSSIFIAGLIMGTVFELGFSLPTLISLRGTDLLWQWPALCGIFILMRRDYDQLCKRTVVQA